MADCMAAATLLQQMSNARILYGDKGYDSNAVRRQVHEAPAMLNIPPNGNRRWRPCFSVALYRDRNVIEPML